MQATARKVDQAASDPDFANFHEKLFVKVGAFIDVGKVADFAWMFTGKPEPNWLGTLEGKFDFFLEKKPTAQQAGGMDWAKVEAQAAREAAEE